MKKLFQAMNKAVAGVVFAVFLLLLNLFFYAIEPKSLVPAWSFACVVVIAAIACLVLYGFFKSRETPKWLGETEVAVVHEEPGKLILICKPNEAFVYGILVSIRGRSFDGFERTIALGVVESVNREGSIQVVLLGLRDGQIAECAKTLRQNRQRITVKATVTYDEMTARKAE